MQFMPSTWADIGVDANGDGVADPNNPEDAIFAAARYLAAAGMPADTYGAIYAYNHADWYVSEVLADAGCYAAEVGDAAFTAGRPDAADRSAAAATRRRAGRSRSRPNTWKPSRPPPPATNSASAASGRSPRSPASSRTSAAGCRRSSSKKRGRSASKRASGSSTASTATTTATSATPTSSTRRSTLAREIWSKGSLEAGVFAHNQADWYVAGGPRARPKKSKAAARPPTSTGASPRSPPKRPSPGAEAVIQPNGLAAAPAERAARGQGGDRRRQLDRHHPLRLGRRPRLLLLLRLRLLRRGQLRPLRRRPARHAAHLRLAGELRRTRPRQVDHDLRQRRPHLHGDRRPALGHGRRRQRHRPPLARRTAVPARVRGPASGRVLVRHRPGTGTPSSRPLGF